jgi:hypothetical protein
MYFNSLPTANCQLPTANCQLPTANCPTDRAKRFDFMVEELSAVSDEASIQSTIRSLINQRDDLLAVAHSLDIKFQNMAENTRFLSKMSGTFATRPVSIFMPSPIMFSLKNWNHA